MEPPPEDKWIKKHPNGCISYKDDEGKMQMWRPEFGVKTQIAVPQKEEAGYIYVLTCSSFRRSDTYKVGYTIRTKSSIIKSHNTPMPNSEVIIFTLGSKKKADKLFEAIAAYKVQGSGYDKYTATVIMPLGNLVSIVRGIEGIIIQERVHLSGTDIRQLVSEEDLNRHATMFLRIYRRSEGLVMRRDGMFLEFVEYLKPLSLYTSYAAFRATISKIGYTTSGTIVMPAKESIESGLRQTSLCQCGKSYLYIITDAESHYRDRYKVGYTVESHKDLLSRYRSCLFFEPIIVATFPGSLETEAKLLGVLRGYLIPHLYSMDKSSEVSIIPLANLVEIIRGILKVDLLKEIKAGPVKELIIGDELVALVKQFITTASSRETVLSIYERFIEHLRKIHPLRFVAHVNFFNALRNLGCEFRVHNRVPQVQKVHQQRHEESLTLPDPE